MNKTVWLKDGVSTFPVQQPMVGQKEFYNTFKAYKRFKSCSDGANISLIAKWGIGKSRIAYELTSEVLGIDKGWIIRNEAGALEKVRLLQKDLGGWDSTYLYSL